MIARDVVGFQLSLCNKARPPAMKFMTVDQPPTNRLRTSVTKADCRAASFEAPLDVTDLAAVRQARKEPSSLLRE